MKKNIRQYTICFFCFALFGEGRAQVVYHGQPVAVTASRLFSPFGAETRMVYVIDREEIEALPAESVQDILQYVSGVELKSRGENTQTDFSIRGSSFEQVLILLDGVCLNDPQTGHHHCDIPVSTNDIERIEILTGHGSSLYGPDGFGGVIHFVTRRATEPQTRLALAGGSRGTLNGCLSHTQSFGKFFNRLHFEKQKSDGYRQDTDYDNTVASCRFHAGSKTGEISGTFGYLDKDFGAAEFYGPALSREQTTTVHGNIGWTYAFRPYIILQTGINGRYHRDDFNLDYLDPFGYENHTRTWVGAVESQLNLRFSDQKEFGMGMAIVREEARSTMLGNHVLFRTGGWFEMLWPIFRGTLLNGGIRIDHHEKWGIQTSPTLGVSWVVFSHIRLRASAGRVFRAPNFTELYYRDTYNQGNVRLQPETGYSLEGGLIYQNGQTNVEMTVFQRDEKDRIEWIRNAPDDVWQAENISSVRCNGITLSHQMALDGRLRISTYYTMIHRSQTEFRSYESKYRFQIPKHHLKLNTTVFWPVRMTNSIFINIKKFVHDELITVLDAKCSRTFGKVNVYLSATNLLNAEYEEITGVPRPGQQARLGMAVNF